VDNVQPLNVSFFTLTTLIFQTRIQNSLQNRQHSMRLGKINVHNLLFYFLT
jgi:hypothetical protein